MAQFPRVEFKHGIAPARTIAADGAAPLFRAPFAGIISAIYFVATATLTGANTHSRTIQVVNKGQNGLGAIVIASLAFVAGVDAAEFDEKALTLSGTAANLVAAEGDILAVVSTHVGDGLADPGGIIAVKFGRTPTA
jgi:hypothetical protein